MNMAAIWHAAGGALAYPTPAGKLKVVLKAARGDLKAAHVRFGDRYRGAEGERQTALVRVGSDGQHDYWSATLHLPDRRFRYAFLLDDGREQVWYGEGGFRPDPPSPQAGDWWFHYPYLHDLDSAAAPAWVEEAVVYQIFVDRFAQGAFAADRSGLPPWGAPVAWDTVAGGDLAGVTDRLDYLAGLGVTCLYLTPVFLAPSNHKYDTLDYYRIDPAFGDRDSARRLVAECHARGMRVLFDGVFNHCGWGFAPFQDVVRHGPRSRYAAWFKVESYPVRRQPRPTYETFGDRLADLPKLDTGHPEVQEYLLKVAEHWTRDLALDGWRLDVANEVHPDFWRELRRRLRSINPEVFLAGEVTHPAGPWLGGDQFDSVTNYPFRAACVDFFARGAVTAEEFAARLTNLRFRYPDHVGRALLNLLGSHDTERFLTLCGEDRRRLALAAFFQFTSPGVPYLYYGDEVGMVGGGDPDCRRCMVWDEARQDRNLRAHFAALARLRRESRVLRHGDFAFLE
ncbi:MAG: glycoside hydrolase family 13 protein, partial [Chitinophagales bacterium]